MLSAAGYERVCDCELGPQSQRLTTPSFERRLHVIMSMYNLLVTTSFYLSGLIFSHQNLKLGNSKFIKKKIFEHRHKTLCDFLLIKKSSVLLNMYLTSILIVFVT